MVVVAGHGEKKVVKKKIVRTRVTTPKYWVHLKILNPNLSHSCSASLDENLMVSLYTPP